MAIAVAGTTKGSGTSVVTLTSWTPQRDELVLLFIAMRDENLSLSNPQGNHLNWVFVRTLINDDDECRIDVWRAMGTAPVTGTITFGVEGNSLPIVAVAVRFSGVHVGGSNGSEAVEVIATDDGPAGSNDDVKVSLTTLSYGALAVAAATHRNTTLTVPGGQTSISANNALGSGTDRTTLSVWSLAVTDPAAVVLGADNDISSSTDWAIVGLSLKRATAISSTIRRNRRVHRHTLKRRVAFKSASGDLITTAYVLEELVASSFSANELQASEVKNSIRLIGNFESRGLINQGDYVYLNDVEYYVLTSVKPYGRWRTEFLGVFESQIREAVPNVILPVNLAAATAETTLWQPALGKRFRLIDLELRISGTVQTILTFRDGTGGQIVLYGAPASATDVFRPVIKLPGILSTTVDNPLTVTRTVAVTLTGFLSGFEE